MPTPLGAHLNDDVNEVRLQKIWVRTRDGMRSTRSARVAAPTRGLLLGVGATLASAAAVALVVWSGTTSERAGGDRLALSTGALPGRVVRSDARASILLRYADGSGMRVHPGTSIVPIENRSGRFSMELERGKVELDVEPEGARRWRVVARDVVVTVLGTSFSVEADGESVLVSVSRGRVHVLDRPSGRERHLFAGDQWTIRRTPEDAPPSDPQPNDAPAAARPGTGPSAGARDSPAAPDARSAATRGDAVETRSRVPRAGSSAFRKESSDLASDGRDSVVPPAGESWRELAKAGEHDRAYHAAREDGVTTDSVEHSAVDLLLLADAARLSGRPRQAVEPLERLVRRHPGDASAPVAAVVLGRLEMDVLKRPGRAQAALERALDLGVPRALKADVESRLERLERLRRGEIPGALDDPSAVP